MKKTMKCKRHLRYQVKSRPRVACEACWQLWFMKVDSTAYGCKYCSFQPTSDSDFCDMHRPNRNLVLA